MAPEAGHAGPKPLRAAPSARSPSSFGPRIALLLVGFCVLHVAFSWDRDFWAPEEDDFAAVTREMREAGDWLVPTLAGRPYFEKPPLLYWAGLVLDSIPGLPPEVGYRLVAALFGVFALWVTYLAGSKFFNHEVAFAAVLIQGTTLLHFRCSTWFLTDVLFASWLALSLTAFGIAALWEPDVRRWKVLGYAGLAGAALSKSPLLAAFLAGAAILVFLVLHRRSFLFLHDIRRLRPGIGIAAVAAVAAPWYVWLTWLYGGDFLSAAFLEQHVERLVGADSHQEPFWHYLLTLPADFLPWSIFLPLAVLYGHARFSRAGPRFFSCWALVVFVSLSCVSSKQGKYLLPMWTPLAVLVAAALLETERESIWESFLGRGILRAASPVLRGLAAALVVLLALWLTGAVSPLLGWIAETLGAEGLAELLASAPVRALLARSSFVVMAAVALAAMAGISFLAAGRIRRAVAGDDAGAAVATFAASIAVCLFLYSSLYGDLDAVKSAKPFCDKVRAVVGRGRLAIYGRPRGSILYYLGRRDLEVFARVDPSGDTPEPEKPIEDFLRSAGTAHLLAIDEDFETLATQYPKLRKLVRESAAGMVGSRRRYLLLRNVPPAAAPGAGEEEGATGQEPAAESTGSRG
jgi:4-amino-4-deoxy-L-arabinose transferase-like glycosyltransferase